MFEYLSKKVGQGVSVTGLIYGNPHQVLVQIEALLVIVVYDGLMTWGILKVIGLIVPLRVADKQLAEGDMAIHGEVSQEPEEESVLAGEPQVAETY